MRIEDIHHFSRRTQENISLHPVASGVTLIVLSLCLLFLGIDFFLYRSITTSAPPWMTESKAVVYLHHQASSRDQEDLVEKLRQLPRIQEIRSVSKDEARKRLEAQLGEWKGILEGIQENPLPLSLEITFKNGEKHPEELESLVEKIRKFPQVEDIFYGKSSLEKLEFLPVVARLAGSWVPGLLALAVVLIVSNSIQLTVSARREELDIYEIIGATPFFARAPFYFEGILQGIAGSFIASSILVLLIALSRKGLPLPLGAMFSWEPWEVFGLTAGIMLCGIALSWLGAWYAIRHAQQT